MKPGYKTTEFWLVLVLNILPWVVEHFMPKEPDANAQLSAFIWFAAMNGASAALYHMKRLMLKAKAIEAGQDAKDTQVQDIVALVFDKLRSNTPDGGSVPKQ